MGNVLVINQFHFHGVRSNGRFFSYLLRANKKTVSSQQSADSDPDFLCMI
ncbi:hypothetical protein HOLDEFILI_02951 [Holdemania filiformis DSM 12042]|uniref:Uncharacterized protein n=1 Tax=Holdemania filiformis DSM 12042 TaxID=545696 RepID=B9YAU4_9FIRM|nr:hypothetical protein HOLDEFILI_02951 [Holdemania filiformis DSM 12042]